KVATETECAARSILTASIAGFAFMASVTRRTRQCSGSPGRVVDVPELIVQSNEYTDVGWERQEKVGINEAQLVAPIGRWREASAGSKRTLTYEALRFRPGLFVPIAAQKLEVGIVIQLEGKGHVAQDAEAGNGAHDDQPQDALATSPS